MIINQDTRILITGCGGMLGDAFYDYYQQRVNLYATDIDVNEIWLDYLDVRDFKDYRVKAIEFKANIIVHLAAITDLEYCQSNLDEAYLTNTIGVENAVYIAKEINATLVYISTAGIFDGTKDTYDDWSVANPINIYGRSKYLGEVFVENNLDKYFIFRAGWMMGGGPKKDKKFVNKIMKQIEEDIRNLYAVNDKLGTPTYTVDFSKNVYKMLNTKYYGLYNMVCEGNCSRYDVAKEIVTILNKSDVINVNIVDSGHFSESYYAPRPYSERLTNTKLNLRGLNQMGNWKTRLKQYINISYDYLIK